MNKLEYKNGYNYDEYKLMAERFKEVKLSFLKDFRLDFLLADYIFCVSNNRILTRKRDVIKRFLGALFNYSFRVNKKTKGADTIFLFTGNAEMRPDYIEAFNKVAAQVDSTEMILINRQEKRFSLSNMFNIFKILIWASQLNRYMLDYNISFDMATFLFRSIRQAQKGYRKYIKNKYKYLITFCDQWSIESAITQLARKDDMTTVTLQHGNGTEIFYPFSSDWYLCNSIISKQNAVQCGIPEDKVVVCGPMKYAGEGYQYAENYKIKKIGVVFDGAKNDESNLELLEIAHRVAKDIQASCLIRFHPNNQRQLYTIHLQENDFVCEDLKEFEDAIDVCLVCNSTLYTDMLYKKKFVYRYKNGKIDLFPQLSQAIFSTAEELKTLLLKVEAEYESSLLEQKKLYNQVYGEEGTRRTYKAFFEMIRRNNERTFN